MAVNLSSVAKPVFVPQQAVQAEQIRQQQAGEAKAKPVSLRTLTNEELNKLLESEAAREAAKAELDRRHEELRTKTVGILRHLKHFDAAEVVAGRRDPFSAAAALEAVDLDPRVIFPIKKMWIIPLLQKIADEQTKKDFVRFMEEVAIAALNLLPWRKAPEALARTAKAALLRAKEISLNRKALERLVEAETLPDEAFLAHEKMDARTVEAYENLLMDAIDEAKEDDADNQRASVLINWITHALWDAVNTALPRREQQVQHTLGEGGRHPRPPVGGSSEKAVAKDDHRKNPGGAKHRHRRHSERGGK